MDFVGIYLILTVVGIFFASKNRSKKTPSKKANPRANNKKFSLTTADQVRDRLRSRFKKEPSESDVYWGMYAQNKIEFAIAGEWEKYRDTVFQMAHQLLEERKLDRAIEFFFEVCYLDANGFRAKNPGRLDTGVVKKIFELKKITGNPDEILHEMFLKTAFRTQKTMKLKAEPEEVFKQIAIQIEQRERLPASPEA